MQIRVLFSLVILVFLIGCASGGTTTPLQAVSAPLSSAYNTVLVEVTSTLPDSDADARALENEIITELRKDSRLTQVLSGTGSPTAAADLKLKADIVEMRKVSTGKRMMLGGLAGRGSVKVNAELLDGRNGTKLGAFTSEGKTSGGTVFAGTTEQALQRAAEQIAGFVTQNMGN